MFSVLSFGWGRFCGDEQQYLKDQNSFLSELWLETAELYFKSSTAPLHYNDLSGHLTFK